MAGAMTSERVSNPSQSHVAVDGIGYTTRRLRRWESFFVQAQQPQVEINRT